MKTKAIATVITPNGNKKIKGHLTTEHAASSYGQPVFADMDGQAYNWADILDIATTEKEARGGAARSENKAAAVRENGRKGGRPRKKSE